MPRTNSISLTKTSSSFNKMQVIKSIKILGSKVNKITMLRTANRCSQDLVLTSKMHRRARYMVSNQVSRFQRLKVAREIISNLIKISKCRKILKIMLRLKTNCRNQLLQELFNGSIQSFQRHQSEMSLLSTTLLARTLSSP